MFVNASLLISTTVVLPDNACFFFLYTGIATLDKRDLNMYQMQSIGRTMGIER